MKETKEYWKSPGGFSKLQGIGKEKLKLGQHEFNLSKSVSLAMQSSQLSHSNPTNIDR